MSPGDTMLGRVVDAGRVSVLDGLHPRAIYPPAADVAVRRARVKLKARTGNVPHEKLARESSALHLVHLWMERVLELEQSLPRLPRLVNTDGEPLLFVEDIFTFAPRERERVLERLLRVKDAWVEEEGVPTVIVFLKRGRGLRWFLKSTVMGRAYMEEDEIQLETNSERRADALCERVKAACSELIQHQVREYGNPGGRAASNPQ
jgi:hypothetical protein